MTATFGFFCSVIWVLSSEIFTFQIWIWMAAVSGQLVFILWVGEAKGSVWSVWYCTPLGWVLLRLSGAAFPASCSSFTSGFVVSLSLCPPRVKWDCESSWQSGGAVMGSHYRRFLEASLEMLRWMVTKF